MLPEEVWDKEQWCLKSVPRLGILVCPVNVLEMQIHRTIQDLLNSILSIWGPKYVIY